MEMRGETPVMNWREFLAQNISSTWSTRRYETYQQQAAPTIEVRPRDKASAERRAHCQCGCL